MAVPVPANRRMRNPIVAEDRRAGWVFIAPAMVIFVVFIFGAILFSFYVSFFDYQLLAKGGIGQLFSDPGKRWVGLDNYRHIIHNKDFWTAFRNTSWYALGVVPAQTITGLVLAVLANRKIRGKTFFRRSALRLSFQSFFSGCFQLAASSTMSCNNSDSQLRSQSGSRILTE